MGQVVGVLNSRRPLTAAAKNVMVAGSPVACGQAGAGQIAFGPLHRG